MTKNGWFLNCGKMRLFSKNKRFPNWEPFICMVIDSLKDTSIRRKSCVLCCIIFAALSIFELLRRIFPVPDGSHTYTAIAVLGIFRREWLSHHNPACTVLSDVYLRVSHLSCCTFFYPPKMYPILCQSPFRFFPKERNGGARHLWHGLLYSIFIFTVLFISTSLAYPEK